MYKKALDLCLYIYKNGYSAISDSLSRNINIQGRYYKIAPKKFKNRIPYFFSKKILMSTNHRALDFSKNSYQNNLSYRQKATFWNFLNQIFTRSVSNCTPSFSNCTPC